MFDPKTIKSHFALKRIPRKELEKFLSSRPERPSSAYVIYGGSSISLYQLARIFELDEFLVKVVYTMGRSSTQEILDFFHVKYADTGFGVRTIEDHMEGSALPIKYYDPLIRAGINAISIRANDTKWLRRIKDGRKINGEIIDQKYYDLAQKKKLESLEATADAVV